MFIIIMLILKNGATEKAKTEREKRMFLDCFRKGRGRSLFVNSLQRYRKIFDYQ